jgi:hypothetical protein
VTTVDVSLRGTKERYLGERGNQMRERNQLNMALPSARQSTNNAEALN